jgi:hypothetical protein
MATERNVQNWKINSIHLDPAGRLVTASPLTLGDYKVIHDSNTDLISYIGTGTGTHSTTEAHIDMSVGAGQYYISQTKLKHPYYSGKPQQIEITVQDFHLQAGVTKRVGYYDSDSSSPFDTGYDGVTIENDGTTFYTRVYKNGALARSNPRSAWLDRLDGTGASGMVMDGTKFTIFEITFLWLGGSTVSWYVISEGKKVLFDYYDHALKEAGVMIRSPKKPVRYEIRSTGGAGTMKQICSAVVSNGQESLVGVQRAVSNDTGITLANTTNYFAMIGIRLKAGRLDSSILMQAVDMLCTTNNVSFVWNVAINPTIAGTPTWISIPNSSVDYFIGNGSTITATGGSVIDAGASFSRSTVSQNSDTIYRLGSAIDGTADVLVLSVKGINAGAVMLNALRWVEI